MNAPEPTDLLGEIYARWIVEMTRHPDMSIELLRIIFDDWQRATGEPAGVTYENTEVGGVPGIMATPADHDPERILVLMHGGGFALGSAISHRKLAGHVANACRARAYVVDFSLAPEHPYPVARDEGLAVFNALVESGHAPHDITLVGDSAGANLAISMTLQLLAEGTRLPGSVITMSPWLNMENNGATLESNDPTDFLIAREGLQANIDRYLIAGASPTDPFVNPLYADLTGFPPLYICAGAVESLLDDAVQLHALAEKAGVDTTLVVADDMQHVYPFLAGNHPRADAEIAAIGDWYRAKSALHLSA